MSIVDVFLHHYRESYTASGSMEKDQFAPKFWFFNSNFPHQVAIVHSSSKN